jgi:RNA polymerase sigma-70 factor, ECF subfamily
MAEGAEADQDLAETLEAMHRLGREAWPTVELSADDFARHLATLAGHSLTVAWLSGRPAADLYLACACTRRQPAALAAFDDHCLSHVKSFLTAMRPDAAFVDECRQLLREKLFVGATPKIAEYTGRGTLIGWLRVVTVRTALNAKRRRTESLDGAPGVPRAGCEQAIRPDYLNDRYREAVKAAIEGSFAVLSSEQRNLLRLHFLDGLTLHQLATLFQVHRATVARWIAQIRERVVEGTRVHLQQQLALKTAELDSMMRLVDSRLELSMQQLLGTAAR